MSNNYDKVLVDKFFRILKDFSETKNYNEKLELIKKYWGDVNTPCVINYTDKCSVTITKDEQNVYHAEFKCDDVDFESFYNVMPEIAETVKDRYLKDLASLNSDSEPEEATQSENQDSEKPSKDGAFDLNLLNNYNDLKLNTQNNMPKK